MKKSLILLLVSVFSLSAFSQKIALVDMEYILSKIPAYEIANNQLDQISKKWQDEVEVLNKEAKNLYSKYQVNMAYMSDELKKKKESEILEKEKQAAELKKKYFGAEGELYKKKASLLNPIQDEIYNAVKQISEEKGISLILDRASDSGILFASPKIDISDLVLRKLGL